MNWEAATEIRQYSDTNYRLYDVEFYSIHANRWNDGMMGTIVGGRLKPGIASHITFGIYE
jgi:hypothetical protein